MSSWPPRVGEVWRVCTSGMWSMTTHPAPRPGTLVLVTSSALFDTKGLHSLMLVWSGGSADVVAGPDDVMFVSHVG